MNDYKLLRKFNERISSESLMFAKGDDKLEGPAIHLCHAGDRFDRASLGIINDGDFKCCLRIVNDEGSIYEFMGDKNTPTLFFNDNCMFFGMRRDCGFHGPVYRIDDSGISVQSYINGAFQEEKKVNVNLPVFSYYLPINFSYGKGDVIKDFKEDEKQYVTRTYTSQANSDLDSAVRAVCEDDGTITMGPVKDNMFNGLVMKYIKDECLIYRFYIDDEPLDKFQLTYSIKLNSYSYIRRDNEDTYTEFVYIKEKGNFTLYMKKLNSLREEIKDKTIKLPFRPSGVNSINHKLDSQNKPIKKDSRSIDPNKELDNLIGLENVKRQVRRMNAYLAKNKDMSISKSMVFTGNPGTGKTEVARILARLMYKDGIIKSDKFVEVDRSGLVAEYVGQTERKVNDVIENAMGGLLFIDEAYSLYTGKENDFGNKVMDVLTKAMEDKRDDLTIIFAGYKEPMQNMIEMNPGFKSRVNRYIDFSNYSNSELKDIAKLMLRKNKYKCEPKVLNEVIKIASLKREDKDFANARTVRNILESLYEIQAERTINEKDDRLIVFNDVLNYEKENDIKFVKEEKKHWNINPCLYDKSVLNGLFNPININDYIKERSVCIKVLDNGVLKGEGSGAFIDKNGIIATCNHVVDKAKEIKVIVNIKVNNGQMITKEYDASFIKGNKKHDVALIGIKDKDMDFPYYQLDNNLPVIGDEVIMGGYPFGGSRFANITINGGFIQSINKDNRIDDTLRIYTDMIGQPGNSGSLVINKSSGAVIGVFAGAALNIGEHMTNEINYMMPINFLYELVKEVNSDAKSK